MAFKNTFVRGFFTNCVDTNLAFFDPFELGKSSFYEEGPFNTIIVRTLIDPNANRKGDGYATDYRSTGQHLETNQKL